jgi:hypothetical protein
MKLHPIALAGNHRAQNKQKNRVQWVGDFGLLTRVIHTREVLQKVGRAVLFSNAGHAKSPKSGALTTVDSEKSQLVSNLFNRLPWRCFDRLLLIRLYASGH